MSHTHVNVTSHFRDESHCTRTDKYKMNVIKKTFTKNSTYLTQTTALRQNTQMTNKMLLNPGLLASQK